MRSNNVDIAKSFAIGSVFLYHLAPDLFKSGFIGVDVFLVITGYLSAMTLSKASGYDFIKGRILRIYPPLSILLISGFICVFIVGYYNEVYGYLKYLISSTVLMTNFHLYLDDGYFSQDLYSNVLFHLWSISLEFQSWIVIAIVASFVAFRTLIYSLGILSVMLAGFALYKGDVNSFYLLTPYRFWEVVLGILAYNLKSRIDSKYSMCLTITVLCIWSSLLFLDIKEHWYFWPISPILAVLLLLSDVRLEAKFKSITLYLSRRTYSLYLWHVPVICICQYYYLMTGWLSIFLILAATFSISELSYRYIEK